MRDEEEEAARFEAEAALNEMNYQQSQKVRELLSDLAIWDRQCCECAAGFADELREILKLTSPYVPPYRIEPTER